MKVCIPFVPGIADSIELRYTLRSYAEHAKDWEPVLVGHAMPAWYEGERIRHDTGKDNVHDDQLAKICKFCHEMEEDQFIYSTDDTMLLQPWSFEPRMVAKSPIYTGIHAAAMTNTGELLNGRLLHDYQLHCPVLRDKGRALMMVAMATTRGKSILHRTAYGNLFPEPDPKPTWDRKMMDWVKEPGPNWRYLSTQDQMVSNPRFIKWLQTHFPKPSPWETV